MLTAQVTALSSIMTLSSTFCAAAPLQSRQDAAVYMQKRSDHWQTIDWDFERGFPSQASTRAEQDGVGHSGYASDYTRVWNGSPYKLHEYQYARSQLENNITGEILPSEWEALIEQGDEDALMAKGEFRQKALDPLRAIRRAYQLLGHNSRTISKEQAEYDYCNQACGRILNWNTYKNSEKADVIEARAMYEGVKNLPWGQEH